jgi:hypothetical protein
MSDIESMFAVLDQEPWLTLSAWADQMADKGNIVKERVIRWMIERRRMPKIDFVTEKRGSTPVIMYHWYFRSVTPRNTRVKSDWHRSRYTSAHALPRTVGVPPYKPIPSMSEAYKEAVAYLQDLVDQLD